jgi:hypothetical protein
VAVLKRVMDKSPKLIIDSLPSWLTSHRFDRSSLYYSNNQTAREESFQYLASFATESVLEKALFIVKRNEHYKTGSVIDPKVYCCYSQDHMLGKHPRMDVIDVIRIRNPKDNGITSLFILQGLPAVLIGDGFLTSSPS